MLSASHVGFHLYEYARHFLTCCKRMLGVDHTCEQGGQIQLIYARRKVWVTCCHGGVPVEALSALPVPPLVPHGTFRAARPSLGGGGGGGISAVGGGGSGAGSRSVSGSGSAANAAKVATALAVTSFSDGDKANNESGHYFGSDEDEEEDEEDEEDELEDSKDGSPDQWSLPPSSSAQQQLPLPLPPPPAPPPPGSSSSSSSLSQPSLESSSPLQPPMMDDELVCRIFGSMEKFRSVVLGGGPDGRHRTRQVIVGLDPLEALRGVPLKLLAFDRFLCENEAWASKVVLVQVRCGALAVAVMTSVAIRCGVWLGFRWWAF